MGCDLGTLLPLNKQLSGKVTEDQEWEWKHQTPQGAEEALTE